MRKRYPVPDTAEKDRIRQSLNMNQGEPFWKCRGKSRKKVKGFEAEGNMDHSDRKHLCDECRCSKVAGSGTDHYGVGFCYEHENVKGMTDLNAKRMVDSTKVAIRQGYPDRIYKYETNDGFIERIRLKAEDAGGMSDLREEINLVRSKVQSLMATFEQSRGELTEGYDKDGCARTMTDATYFKLITGMAESVGKLSEKNLKITEADYVHVDQVFIWFASVLRILQREVEPSSPEVYEKVVTEIKMIPQVQTGRKK